MLREVCRAKLHRLTVTEADLEYEGSLTLDETLMRAADLVPYEKIQVANITNGNRFTTYVIPGPADSGVVCINGAAAHLGKAGDQIIVMAFGQLSPDELATFQPKKIFVDEQNRPKETVTA